MFRKTCSICGTGIVGFTKESVDNNLEAHLKLHPEEAKVKEEVVEEKPVKESKKKGSSKKSKKSSRKKTEK